MLVDEIIRALRDPEYRAQLMAEVHSALPDGRLAQLVHGDPPEDNEESASEAA